MVWSLFAKRPALPRDQHAFNSIHQSSVQKDNLALEPSKKKTLAPVPSNGNRVAGPTGSPSGINHHGGTGRHDAYYIPAAQTKPRTALRDPDDMTESPAARTQSSEVPELNREAWKSHKALYPQLNEMVARISIESTEGAALDAAAAMEQVNETSLPLSDVQAPQWSPQGDYLTSTQETALLGAIDGIGIALSKNLSQESIACSINELEQLLDQVRPIPRCEVPQSCINIQAKNLIMHLLALID
jgi:hypothetical protein